MTLFLAGVSLLVGSGFAALMARRSAKLSTGLGAGGVVVACAMALVPALRGLNGATDVYRHSWNVPGGSFFVEIDALSAFFLIPIFGLSLLAAVYGARYMLPFGKSRSLGAFWFFFNIFVAAMAMVVVARNAVLFLMAWEVMAVASFFLVTFEHDRAEVREAGWTYLVATHFGTAFLLVFFLLLGNGSNDALDFDHFHVVTGASTLFLLAVIGFGTKAGFMPLHVWLPEAHPAAPSPVSALMSGVMIKLGIYGLLRALTFLGPPPAWWGWTLVGIGLTSGLMGILFALAQHDIKRLLAYSSVENIGIVALGLGLGVLGVHFDTPTLAVLGFGGALLHVLNHACFKGLLFLGAGAVVHAGHTREIDRLGGLLKRMPRTGAAFLVGAAAISGMPLFNGFVGEFLIYLGAYEGVRAGGYATTTGVVIIGGLALIGGLAAACFAKAFGIAFLGEPRTPEAAQARESSGWMVVPMLVMAGGCVALGLGGALVLRVMGPVIAHVTGSPTTLVATQLDSATDILGFIALAAGALIVTVTVLAATRWLLLRGREVRSAVTWDCGYSQPTTRMQYSASSFVQPLTTLFEFALRTRRTLIPPKGFFPQAASIETRADDVSRRYVYGPLFLTVGRVAMFLKVIQHGRLTLYVLYIALTLAALLIWNLL